MSNKKYRKTSNSSKGQPGKTNQTTGRGFTTRNVTMSEASKVKCAPVAIHLTLKRDPSLQPGQIGVTPLFEDVPERSEFPDIRKYADEFVRRNLTNLLILRSRERFVLLDFVEAEDYEKCRRALYLFQHDEMPDTMFTSPYAFGGGVVMYVMQGMVSDGQLDGHPLGTGKHIFPAEAMVVHQGYVLCMASDSTKRKRAKSA